MTPHIETRRKLKEIPEVKTFKDLLDRITISDFDKKILEMHYIQGHDFRFIADLLGYSEARVKAHHRSALKKISKII